MSDTGQDIEVPDEATIAELEALEEETERRFAIIAIEPGYARVQWRDYYKTATGKRSKDANNAYKLLDIRKKRVKLI